jgi:hypothetical protein
VKISLKDIRTHARGGILGLGGNFLPAGQELQGFISVGDMLLFKNQGIGSHTASERRKAGTFPQLGNSL